MTKSVAIIGAGVLGLLVARQLAASEWRVSVYERLPKPERRQATSYAAGGMLAPYSELESSEPEICRWGLRSLELWPAIIASCSREVFYRQEGSLLLSHQRDWPYFQQLLSRIKALAPPGAYRTVEPVSLESELSSQFNSGFYLENEAQLDNRQLLDVLTFDLEQSGVSFQYGAGIEAIEAFSLRTAEGSRRFDLICDCRGIGAVADLPDLRGVRGEAFLVHAPEVSLRRPIRLMHPRYAVYIVPRAASLYYIGATSIESASAAGVTVRSSLELLSAAYSLHAGFAEATIVESLHGVRPAFPDHKPRIELSPGLIRLNGLYRHGFLLSPLIAEQLALFLSDREIEPQLFHFV